MLGHSIDVSPLIKSIQDLSTAAQEINIEKEVMSISSTFLTKSTSKKLAFTGLCAGGNKWSFESERGQ